ncbi:hypothetical protein D3C80_1901880 [compost metagenome]
MAPMPSARRPRTKRSRVVGRPTMLPSARNIPVDSTMVTSITMHMEITATASKVGTPKAKGVMVENQGVSAMPSSRMSPRKKAMTKPTRTPNNTAMLAMKPLAKRLSPKISSNWAREMAR